MQEMQAGSRLLSLLAIVLAWARQLHLYTLVGGAVFLIDLTAYWAFMHYFGSWFLYAHFVSRSIGGVSCFLLNRFVTFRKAGIAGLWTDIVRFAILYAASFLFSSVLVYLYVEAARVSPVPGKVIAECTVFLFNYTIMKYWVMKPQRSFG